MEDDIENRELSLRLRVKDSLKQMQRWQRIYKRAKDDLVAFRRKINNHNERLESELKEKDLEGQETFWDGLGAGNSSGD